MSRDPSWSSDPLVPWDLIREEIARFLAGQRRSGESRGPAPEASPGGWAPPADVVELADSVRVRFDLPGVRVEAVDLSVTGTTLILKGARELAVDEGGPVRVTQRERPSGRFARQISLPCEVDADAIQAELRDGILEIRLPKAQALRSRTIPIRTT